MDRRIAAGFSRLSKDEKISLISGIIGDEGFASDAASYQHNGHQDIFDAFSENTLCNYILPFGVAPNFLINEKYYHVPMVTEESSVVAAAAAAAKFWESRGGFRARVISTLKKGHIHFLWDGDPATLKGAMADLKKTLVREVSSITARMEERGGGIVDIRLEDWRDHLPHYFRLGVDFETVDSMGANFINTVLEQMALVLRSYFADNTHHPEIIMSILSNHVPECLVESEVTCALSQLENIDGDTPARDFVKKFKLAVDIATIDAYRAATHNKGIMNGVDAVILATGNDFRAVEAGAHTFAAMDGKYRSLSEVITEGDNFIFRIRMPMALGTVGGLTSLHPLAKRAMQILGNPSARELMMISASVGLASNFSAVRALVTKGIQKGHMKMHLSNMLLPYQLDADQRKLVESHFQEKPVSHAAVHDFILHQLMHQGGNGQK